MTSSNSSACAPTSADSHGLRRQGAPPRLTRAGPTRKTTRTMPFEFGDVVLVRFPFTNQTAFKQRPAVVISGRAYNAVRPDVVIMAITSQLHSPSGLGEVL